MQCISIKSLLLSVSQQSHQWTRCCALHKWAEHCLTISQDCCCLWPGLKHRHKSPAGVNVQLALYRLWRTAILVNIETELESKNWCRSPSKRCASRQSYRKGSTYGRRTSHSTSWVDTENTKELSLHARCPCWRWRWQSLQSQRQLDKPASCK